MCMLQTYIFGSTTLYSLQASRVGKTCVLVLCIWFVFQWGAQWFQFVQRYCLHTYIWLPSFSSLLSLSEASGLLKLKPYLLFLFYLLCKIMCARVIFICSGEPSLFLNPPLFALIWLWFGSAAAWRPQCGPLRVSPADHGGTERQCGGNLAWRAVMPSSSSSFPTNSAINLSTWWIAGFALMDRNLKSYRPPINGCIATARLHCMHVLS